MNILYESEHYIAAKKIITSIEELLLLWYSSHTVILLSGHRINRITIDIVSASTIVRIVYL